MSSQEKLVSVLSEKNLVLSVAESYTGGAVAKSIVSVSGASKVFYEGLVCYNTKSKEERLSVKEETVKENGVVSSKVAYEMALGLLRTGNCDVAIATTGYADKNDDDKIVGLGYIAVGYNGKIAVSKNVFDGDRERIIQKSAEKAVEMTINILTDGDEKVEDSVEDTVESDEPIDEAFLVDNESVGLDDNLENEEFTAVENNDGVDNEEPTSEEDTTSDSIGK